MLRRHSTKSKSDLHRRKSTASVRSVALEHISAATAERDAKIAALQAFSRGQDRHSVDTASMFPPKQTLPHHSENSSPTAQRRRNDSAASECEGSGLGRRQSVRFVGPDSGLQTRASRSSMRTLAPHREDHAAARRSTRRSQNSQNFETGRSSALQDTQIIQLPDRISSCGKTLVTPRLALRQDYVQALMPDLQQYTPEDDVASMPSSYRRVRKTRSMVTTRNLVSNSHDDQLFTTAPTADTAPATTWSRFSFLNRKENEPVALTPTLKAPKSMSFLRHRKDRVSTSTANKGPAYDDLSPMSTSPAELSLRSQILPKPSMFFGAKGHRLGPNMRKTLRISNSNAALPISETADSISTSIHGSLRVKARQVSSSIKSKFKNLFINKSEDDAKVPAQQIEAQRSHVADLFDVDHFGPAASEVGRLHVHENSSVSRVSSRLPVLHAVPSNEQLRSRSGSINSFPGEDRRVSDEKSRVTSWASTEANTIIAHRFQESEEGDRQRLSIITKNGLQASAPSSLGPKLGLQTITSQEELAPQTISERLVPGTAVDSQRVYAALMKKMSDTQQLLDTVRKSSEGSDPFRTLSPPTSDDSSDNGEVVFSHAYPHTSGHHKMYPALRDHLPERNPARLSAPLESAKAISGPESGQYRPLSPPVHLTPKGVDKPLIDRSSAFFGSPTSHLFRTRSPWRKCLQEAIDRDRGSSQELTVDANGLLDTATDVADKRADSASNYSQDTQTHRVEMLGKHPVEGFSQNMNNHGNTTFDGDAPTAYHPTGERQVSTASSIDWKARLSHNEAKVDRSPRSPTRVSGRPCEVEYAMPTMPRAFGRGHIREAAQTGSYEEDEYNVTPAVRMPTNSTTPLGAMEPNVIKLTQQRSVMQTTPPSASSALRENARPRSRTSVSPDEDGMSYIVPKDALRPRASPLSSYEGSRSNSLQAPAHEPAPPIRQAKSLAQMQTVVRGRAEETGSPCRGSPTVRLMRKSPAKLEGAASPAMSTPGFSTVFERHFGSLPKSLGGAKENQSPNRGEEDGRGEESGGVQQARRLRGSKTMVDLCLNSRTRQQRSGEGGCFI